MTMMSDRVLRSSLDDLPALAGRVFGPSSWRTVTQGEVTRFAALTGDANPVHLDPHFAAGTPFGTTIAHGYFTLSLVAGLLAEVLEVTDVGVGVNYGLDRVRFPAPLPVGGRIRLHGVMAAVDEIGGGFQAQPEVTVEIDGSVKPACVARLVLRYYR